MSTTAALTFAFGLLALAVIAALAIQSGLATFMEGLPL